jgi:biotin carboxyl carrier protein
VRTLCAPSDVSCTTEPEPYWHDELPSNVVSTSEYSQTPSSESSAGSVDAEQVQRAKREIQSLVQEIAELSRSQMEPAAFYDAMLNKVVAALAAPGGAVWTLADAGSLQLVYQINLRQTGLVENQIGQAQHGRLLQQVLVGTEGALVAPHSGSGEAAEDDENAAANPTDFLLVMAPVSNDQGPQGVLEVFQRPGARTATQRGYLRFLLQISEFAGDYLKARRLQHLSEKQTLWEQLESFTRTAHEKLEVRQTAYTIANEGRRLIGCDRVSVAIRRGGRCRIEAVSGQDTFDKRSNVTVLLGKLATAVTRTGEDVWYSGDTSELAPQVEEAIEAYVDESHTRAMAILPLSPPVDPPETLGEDEEPETPQIIGALVVEQMVDSRPPEGFLQRVEVVRSHSASALGNALEYEGLFLMPVWRFLGKGMRLFRGRTLPKSLAVTGAIVAVLLWACLWPADFTVEGNGRLRPTVREHVFAQLDGDVQDVLVDDTSPVKKGDVLVVERSLDLEKETETTRGQLEQTRADINSTSRELLDDKDMSDADKSQKIASVAQLKERQVSLEKQMELLKEKRQLLTVRSPIDGQVVEWKVQEKLKGRPVGRGQILMEVADPKGDWELEVQMPESRMGYVQEWKASGGELPVTFILATSPSQKIEGKVVEIHRSAEVHGDEGNSVLLRVAFDQQRLREVIGDPKIGAGATAKIHCGRRPIGYVWLHDAIDFVRAKILFRLW